MGLVRRILTFKLMGNYSKKKKDFSILLLEKPKLLKIIWTAPIAVGYNQKVFKIGQAKLKFLTVFTYFPIIAFGLGLRFININGNNLVFGERTR